MPLKSKKRIQNIHFAKTEEVLSKDSAEELNEGKNPGPLTEIRFRGRS